MTLPVTRPGVAAGQPAFDTRPEAPRTPREDVTPLQRRLAAEFVGTFWLVLGGCGAAVLAAGFPKVEIGLLGVALAFGLTVLTMAYAFGHISGGHFNPAVTPARSTGPALFVGGWALAQLWVFWLAPLVGAALAALVYPLIAGDNGAEPVAEEGQDTADATISAGAVPAARTSMGTTTDEPARGQTGSA